MQPEPPTPSLAADRAPSRAVIHEGASLRRLVAWRRAEIAAGAFGRPEIKEALDLAIERIEDLRRRAGTYRPEDFVDAPPLLHAPEPPPHPPLTLRNPDAVPSERAAALARLVRACDEARLAGIGVVLSVTL